MSLEPRNISIITIILFIYHIYENSAIKQPDCFCTFHGRINECQCSFETVDYFNNVKIFPRLKSLLRKDYFRYFKVNLKKECPFWTDDAKCAMKFCKVEPCKETEVPLGIKGGSKKTQPQKGTQEQKDILNCHEKTTPSPETSLDFLNTSLTNKTQEILSEWTNHDCRSCFCVHEDETNLDSTFVDLTLNPERYTGYSGPSAHRMWKTIYKENCFGSRSIQKPSMPLADLQKVCLEERAFYKAISGLHASINIHLCSDYLLGNSLAKPRGEWGPNLAEFVARFSPEHTQGEGPNWLKNLYFVYLLELRAIAKIGPILQNEHFYTGNEKEDFDTQMAINDLLKVINTFPNHFDESKLFKGDKELLKLEFQEHFKNVSRIMDCVGCEKCKLWGKLQIQGLGTALKILFSGIFDADKPLKNLSLQRNEIVSLVNAFGRLSTSIYKLDDFREMLQEKTKKGHFEL